jgi:hypothetical protein
VEADDDLAAILRHSGETWGSDQVEAHAELRSSGLGRARDEIEPG